VRSQVESALKDERAKAMAAKAASDFALALYEARNRKGFALDAFLSAQGTPAKPLAPFSREAGPAELGGSQEVAAAAFQLNEQNFVSEPVATPNGTAVLFFKELQPSRKPLLTEVRERVAKDYLESERNKRFLELGKKVKADLQARVKAGESFEKAAAAAGSAAGLSLETKMLAPFSLRNRPADIDYAVAGALERLEQGQVSDLVLNGDKGIFVYVAEKKLPDLTEANPHFAEVRAQLGARMGQSAAAAYISDLVAKELKRTDPKGE
jgi:peptidyl-prolyl cis-trans isomerase D